MYQGFANYNAAISCRKKPYRTVPGGKPKPMSQLVGGPTHQAQTWATGKTNNRYTNKSTGRRQAGYSGMVYVATVDSSQHNYYVDPELPAPTLTNGIEVALHTKDAAWGLGLPALSSNVKAGGGASGSPIGLVYVAWKLRNRRPYHIRPPPGSAPI